LTTVESKGVIASDSIDCLTFALTCLFRTHPFEV
jgi:hypothetical protein